MEKIIKMNTPQQNELLALWCIENKQLKKLKGLLESGMPLTPFMLTSMVFFEYSDDIIKGVIVHAKSPSKDIFSWAKKHFCPRDLGDILRTFDDKVPNGFISNENAVNLKLWTYLVRAEAWDLLAKNAPEVLERLDCYDALGALLKADFAKYAPFVAERGMFTLFWRVPGGWLYLMENGYRDNILNCVNDTRLSGPYGHEICDYCRKNDLIDELYKREKFDFLIENGEWEPFAKNKSTYYRFLLNFPEKVNWEELWKINKSESVRHKLLLYAEDVADQNKDAAKFYSRHTGLFAFLNK